MPHEHDDVEVWHIDRQGLSALDTAPAAEARDAPEASDLPLVVEAPMRVRFADRAVALDRQGLYMFHYRGRLRWDAPAARPDVVKREHADTAIIRAHDDPGALFAGLATLHVHGWVHCAMSVEEKIAWMKRGLLSCTCGEIAAIGIRLLESLGYRARPVGALRVREPYDARDDCHALMEYFAPELGKWVLVDLDTHSTFALRGRALHLGEVADCIHAGERFEIVPITPPGFAIPDTTGYVAPQTGPTFMTFKMLSGPHLRRWFERVFEVPIIEADGRRWFWHPDDALADRAAKYGPGAERLDRAAWLARFYGDPLTREDA